MPWWEVTLAVEEEAMILCRKQPLGLGDDLSPNEAARFVSYFESWSTVYSIMHSLVLSL